MKIRRWMIENRAWQARSVMECGGPPPLSGTGSTNWQVPSARGLAHSKTWRHFVALALLALLATLNPRLSTVFAQGTAFTYQGRLADGSAAANGIYDLRFTIYDAATNGSVVAGPITNAATAVSNGLFAVMLDFGNVFDGTALWLDISARTNGAGSFTALTPRQPITATPYALYTPAAASAGAVTGPVAAGQLTGTISSNQVAPGSITSGMLAAGSVTAVQLASGAVGRAQLAASLASGIVPWQADAGTSLVAVVNTGYLLTNAEPTTLQLPGTASVGDIVRISGVGAGDWKLVLSAGQSILTSAGQLVLTNQPAEWGTNWTARETNRNWTGIASSADGNKLVAAAHLGLIYTSANAGTNWTPSAVSSLEWFYIASSADGNRLAAAVYNGTGAGIFRSTNAGSTWSSVLSYAYFRSVASSGDGRVLAALGLTPVYISTNWGATWTARDSYRSWQAVAMSDDGSKMVAAVNPGQLYTSTDYGATWMARESSRTWSVVASSPDGNRLVAGAYNGYIYTSTNSGVTWTLSNSGTNAWSGIALSTNGARIFATVVGGRIYLSPDFGATWTVQETNRNWGRLAMSADGNKMAAVVSGGQIYTAETVETPEFLGGGPGSELALQTLGNNQFRIINATGVTNNDGGTLPIGLDTKVSRMGDTMTGGLTNTAGFYGNGAGLTGLSVSAANVTGTLALSQLPGAVLTNNAGGVNLAGNFIGDGGGLTNLSVPATNLTGTLPDARLSGNVPLLNGTNLFTGANTFTGTATLTNTANQFAGTLTGTLYGNLFGNTFGNLFGNVFGSGSGLTGLNASQLAEGTVPDARLSGNVALLAANQLFTGTNTLAGSLIATNPANQISGVFTGNGAGLTNLVMATLGGLSASNFWQLGGNNVPGGQFLGSTNNQAVEIRVNNTRALRLEPTANDINNSNIVNIVGGSIVNSIAPGVYGSVIAGGGAAAYQGSAYSNTISADMSFLGGGRNNSIQPSAQSSVLGGGYRNTIETYAEHTFLGGGYHNSVQTNAYLCVLGGGQDNSIQPYAFQSFLGSGAFNTIQSNANRSFLGGGENNSIQPYAAVSVLCGGYCNTNSGALSVVPGGYKNLAGGNYSFAAGYQAKAINEGAFVWSDSTGAYVTSTNANSVTMRASGGYRLFSDSGLTAGVYLAPGGGSWTSMSDRNAKTDLEFVDASEILAKVTTLPLTTWRYKSQDASIRHIGPMAQDFKAAFAVGESDSGITSVDADGVALAAIQGLNEKIDVRSQKAEDSIRKLEAENAELKARLEKLERFLSAKNEGRP